MSFSKLPNELVCKIVSYPPPDDLREASITSNFMYSLSKPFLELACKWHYVQLGRGQDESTTDGAQWAFPTAAKFLDEIVHTPQIAQYVACISTDVEWDGPSLGEEEEYEANAEHARELAQAHDGFQQMLEGSPYFDDHVISTRDSLLKGLDDAYFCLLLVLLPNLRKLTFCDPRSQMVSAMVWRLVNVAMLDQSPGKLMHALSHLEIVELLHNDTELGVYLDFAVPFAGLPSLRTICGNMVVGCPTAVPDPSTGDLRSTDENDSDRCKHAKAGEQCPIVSLNDGDEWQLNYKTCSMWPFEPRVSNVETLRFSYSNTAPQAVELFLPAFKNLRKFEYESRGCTVSHETFQPQNYVKALLKYQGHSLEHLEITGHAGDFEEACVKDLREFQNLKFASLSLALLSDDDVFDNGGPVIRRLVVILPPSIQTFSLDSASVFDGTGGYVRGLRRGARGGSSDAKATLCCAQFGRDDQISGEDRSSGLTRRRGR